ncbi:MAG: AAA family ATPase [Beduini sp.]|uniref:AAA family ATPase n=1 Tax=Beduini sp. TaxID=1922300 RepID=UPI0039A1E8A1
MANLDKIEEYNNGTLFPDNYEDTYLATKHVQNYPLEIMDDIVGKLKQEVANAELYFDDDDMLKEIATGLIRGNIILQGPPGTGKTTLAAIICRVFNVKHEVITAVSDWTTYDTIGGLQPSVDDEGNEVITGKNGRIVESIIECCNTVLAKEKYTGLEQASWLVVDELNRSEIDKVFGDLFTVFGSDDIDKRKMPLWFENDPNKKTLYVPRRYRIIGLMNNFDKNYVFDLSHGLARRFTIISVLPPKEEKFDQEIQSCKDIIAKHLPEKINTIGTLKLDETLIKLLFADDVFQSSEKILLDFLKLIRYQTNAGLGLLFGTAQIIDLYENIVIQMILDNYLSMVSDKNNKMHRIIDAAVNDRIVPQIDGVDYLKLKKFNEITNGDSKYEWFVKTKYALETLG